MGIKNPVQTGLNREIKNAGLINSVFASELQFISKTL
jgi:hypothetical protein